MSSVLPKPICGAAARAAAGEDTGATGAKAAVPEMIASMVLSDGLKVQAGTTQEV